MSRKMAEQKTYSLTRKNEATVGGKKYKETDREKRYPMCNEEENGRE
jgi:hypothetical protein